MLSSVFISGRLGRLADSHTRMVEIDSPIPSIGGAFPVHEVPVRCPRSSQSSFFHAKEGSFIVLKGRLESDPVLGLVVVLEIEEIYGSGNLGEIA